MVRSASGRATDTQGFHARHHGDSAVQPKFTPGLLLKLAEAAEAKDADLAGVYRTAAATLGRNRSHALRIVREAKQRHVQRTRRIQTDEADRERAANLSVATRRGRVENCSKGEDFLGLLRRRKQRWLNRSYVLERSLWQRAIDDKLLGYIFAREHGVRTPDVLWCSSRGVNALPTACERGETARAARPCEPPARAARPCEPPPPTAT